MRCNSFRNHVILNQILSFYRILNKDCMAHAVVVGVSRDCKIMHAMDSCPTIVTIPNCVVFDVRLGHATDHMEVDRVLAQQEGLADVVELDVGDATY